MCARPAHPELRGEILKAATRIIEDCGPDCVTMRQVAEEVGYTPTTLYLYFKDKDAILREVVVEGFEDLADFLASAAVGPTPLDQLRQRTHGYIVWGLLHPGIYQLALETRSMAGLTSEQGERMTRSAIEGAQALADAVAAGQLTGIGDPMKFGNVMWAATHGVTSLAISRRLVPGADTMTAAELTRAATAIGDTLINCVLAPHLV
jgi:AcrR family transcriptional regulator